VVLAGALTAIVAIPAAKDLEAARSVLEGDADDLTRADVASASERLRAVEDRLAGPAARVLGFVPVVGSSLAAMRAVAESAQPVLSSGLELKEQLDALRDEGLLAGGRIRVAALQALESPLRDEVTAIRRLQSRAHAHRNGWVAPPVWDALDEIARRSSELAHDAAGATSLLDGLGGLLGTDGPRTYLVMLVNNAELRGAGGALTGVGTLTVEDGRLSLGSFDPRELLVRKPYRPVPAPPEYERRYGAYLANTTLWVNATYSPDVPDDALVAARLYERVEGIPTDGAFLADPRGLAALLPADARVPVTGTDLELTPRDLPGFVYSDAHEVFDSNTERKDAILAVGQRTFEEIIAGGSSDRAATDAAGAAFAAGHLRFVSFDDGEQEILDELGVSGDLAPPDGDVVRVAVQNWGGGRPGLGSKLDYWVDRIVRHQCHVKLDGSALCANEVTLKNATPAGLTRYVAGYPYGMLRSNVETYLPQGADVQLVQVEGADAEHETEEDEGHVVVEVFVRVPRDEDRTITVQYALPARPGGYSLSAHPQPLARDALLKIALELPGDWTVRGPGEERDGVWRFSGDFIREVELHASPDQRTGIPGLWDSLTDFWSEPLLD
jgi:hypothetical protein